jgi:protein TonB
MSYILNKPRALDEIVFRGRNKSYGAFVLRTEYPYEVIRALVLMILGVIILTLAGWIFSRKEILPDIEISQIPQPYMEVPVDLRPTPKQKTAPDVPKKSPPPPASSNATTIYTVSAEDTARKDSSDLTAAPTDPEQNGLAGGDVPMPSEGGSNMGDPGADKPDEIREPPEAEYPEYEGGLLALKKFVAQRVIYPRAQADLGNSGTVLVRFVVDEKGQISSAKIKYSAGPDFDNEALRVVKLIPPFKTPGKIAGKPVKVYFELPIRFKIN